MTQSSIYFELPNQVEANTAVLLKLLQISNPNTMAITQSFNLATLGSESGVIDQVSSLLTVQCSIPAQLNVTSVSVSLRTVGATTSATFRLSLPIRYSAGGYLLINMPGSVGINSTTLQCILLIGFVDDLGFCSSTNSTQLKLYGTIN
jgi:hypothetical protein